MAVKKGSEGKTPTTNDLSSIPGEVNPGIHGVSIVEVPVPTVVEDKPKTSTLDKVTPEKVTAVINRIENGQSERSACKDENVSRASFRTTALRQGAGDHYARALEALAQDQVEALEKTIEDMRSGEIDAQMARVEIDARKWFASKFLPKRYGDKMDITSDGKPLPTPIFSGLSVDKNAGDDIPDDTKTT
jgi:hypothetical protein